FLFFFFFSSRRRHTRSYGDWSSDVCSSDLLLLRYSDPTQGKILINDIDLREVCLQDWLAQIGYISQTSRIFDGTIRDNVLYGLRSEERRVGKECRYEYGRNI